MLNSWERTKGESKLKLLRRKTKVTGEAVAVCLEEGGVCIAKVRRHGGDRIPYLEFSLRAEFSSLEQGEEILEKTLRRHSLQKIPCVDVLAPDNYQLTQVELEGLGAEEEREAARWQIRDRIDYPPEQAVIDVFDVASFSGDRKPSTYAVSAREGLLRGQVESLEKAGFAMTAIDIAEFSLRNICDLFAGGSRGEAILLLLEDRGILTIVRDGVFYLARFFNTGMDDLLPYADGQYETLTDRLDGVVLEIQRSFDFCESSLSLPMVSRLLVAQTKRRIPSLTAYLGEYLATTVEELDFEGVLETPDGMEQIDLNRCLLAIGGALRQEEG